MLIELFSDLYPNHNFRWDKRGQGGMGFCPMHNDRKSRSLSIYVDARGRERWRCFSEGIGGSELEAVSYANKGMTREGANQWLIAHGYLGETEIQTKDRIRNKVYAAFYQYTNDLLINSEQAVGLRTYIARRNVKTDTLSTAPIGYYPKVDEVKAWLLENEVPPEVAEELVPGDTMAQRTEGSLLFFYRTSYDTFSRIKFRNVTQETQETGKIMYQLGRSKAKSASGAKDKAGYFSWSMESTYSEHAIIVEGEFDVGSLFSLCRTEDPEAIEPIYCFGSGSSMDYGVEVLKNMGAENLYVFPDNDGPGLEYAFKLAETFPHTFIIMPESYEDGSDPAAWAGRSDFASLSKAFKERIPAFTWIGKKLAEEVQLGGIEEQSHAKEKVLAYARKMTPSDRELFLKAYAPITGASFDALVEEVQNNSKVRYRKIFNTDGFGVQMNVTQPGKKEISWEPISDVILDTVKDIVYEDDGKETARELILKVSSAKSDFMIRVSAEDFEDDRRLSAKLRNSLGSSMWVKPRSIMYVKEACLQLQSPQERPVETVYQHTGWREGKYLMPNGYVDEDGFHQYEGCRVEIPTNLPMFSKLRLDDPPADMEYARGMIRDHLLKVFPYSVTLPYLAHVFWTPLMSLFPIAKPYCLWVVGATGSFKTAFTSMMASFFGDFKYCTFETWRSTTNAIEKSGYFLKDCLYVVDDYKSIDVDDKKVTSVIQSYGDGHGKGRLSSDLTHRDVWYIRGNMISTGEDIPQGEASVVARTLVLTVRGRGNSEHLSHAQTNHHHLPGIMAKFIQWVAQKKLKDTEFEAEIRRKGNLFKASHGRTSEVLAINAWTWELVAEFLGLQDLTPEYYKGMEVVLKQMNMLTQQEQAGVVFMESIQDLLASGRCFLEGINGYPDTPHDQISKRIGYVEGEYIYLLSASAIREVSTFRQGITGTALKYSATAIYEQLLMAGLLVPAKDQNTHSLRLGGTKVRVVKLKREVLGTDEKVNRIPEPNRSQVWAEENGAILDRPGKLQKV